MFIRLSVSGILLLLLVQKGSAINIEINFPGQSAIDTIENFNDGNVELLSYENEDANPTMWELNNLITYDSSSFSLKLFGNTWKLEPIEPLQLDSGNVWQVSANVEQVGEIQGFGITDSVNTLLYSFAGTEEVDPDLWITVYQGAFPNYTWNSYKLPVADDWLARFGYLPEIKGIIFVNDRDFSSYGSIYFDEIIDVTYSLPIAPKVKIIPSYGNVYKNTKGLKSVDVHFKNKIYDPDSKTHTYYWIFGDDSVSNVPDPLHTFIIEDDHDYTVQLTVADETNLQGNASCKINVDPGLTSFPVTMNFIGDIMLARGIENYIFQNGIESVFDPINSDLGDAAEITVANLECPLTDEGTPHPTKPIVFRGQPEFADGLSYAGIDIVTLANNHILDYGIEGLEETQSVLDERNILHMGAGADIYEAMLPAFYSESGVNFAFLGSSDRTGQYNNYQPYLDAGFNKPGFADLTEYNVSQQINSVKDVSDFIVYQMHSGSEYSTSPDKIFDESLVENYSPDFRSPMDSDIEMRHFAIDQGADVVICHHPHIIHPFEIYNGKLIAHSLGNFIFDLSYTETFPSVILNAKINETGFYNYTVTPVYIDDYIPVKAKGELGLYLLDDMASRSKQLNTILNVDRKNVTAEIILDTTIIKPKPIFIKENLILDEKDGDWISSPVPLRRNGNIAAVNSIQPDVSWKYRLGRELIWFGNFEDEGCTLWEIDHQDEWYDTLESFTGKRSLCQERNSGQLPLNTNFELPFKIYDDNNDYSIHAFIKTENASNAGIEIQFFEQRTLTSPIGEEDLNSEIDSTTGWTFYHNDFSLPQNTQFINLRLRSEAPESGTSYTWFDNAGLIQWTDWIDNQTASVIINPNDYYWMQIKTDSEILKAEVNYTEIIYTDIIVSVDESEEQIPGNFVLYQNYPNPFNPSTKIKFVIPKEQTSLLVTLKVYDILGSEITTLVNEEKSPGIYEVEFPCKNLSSGIYFYQLKSGKFIQTKKMVFIK